MGIYVIVCIAIIILAMLQSKDSAGASNAVVGGSSAGNGNFYEKNKGRTKEGKMKRWTILLGIVFVILSVGLGIIYEIGK